jgi:ribosomal protein S18 acetylase RimI-like enzyme
MDGSGQQRRTSSIVTLSPHSKGGHLVNLAVAPQALGQGVGQNLVQRLLAVVSHHVDQQSSSLSRC